MPRSQSAQSDRAPHVDIYDFDYPEALQHGVEPWADTRFRMNIVGHLAAVVVAILVFAAGAACGVWFAQ